MNYQVEINGTDGEHLVECFDTKREVIRFIAKSMEVTQTSIHHEIEARADSSVYRDSVRYCALVTYDDGDY